MSTAYSFIQNARIESADIRFDRGFILTAYLHLDYDGTCQAFGGFGLGGSPFDTTSKMAQHGNQPNIAADFIGGCMAVADVEKFSDLKGRIIRVAKEKDEWGDILAIGHPIKDTWYEPKTRFALLKSGDVT